MNLGSLLINSAGKYPKRTAIISQEGRWSYTAFDERTNRLAGAFLNAGLKKGDRIAILFYNSSYFVEAYFAAVKIGLVVTPVNYRFTGSEVTYVLNDAQPLLLLYGPEFEKTLRAVRDQLVSVRHFVSPHNTGTSLAVDFEDFLAGGRADIAIPASRVNENDPCQLMYTSGTTGKPKGAMLTHRNVLWNLFNTIWAREDKAGERAVIVGPLYHTAALNNHLTIQVALGGTSIIIRKFEPQSLLQTIEKEKATIVSGAPALYNKLLQHPSAHEYDTRSITKCTSGSDKLPMEIKKRLLKFFPNITGVYDVYGLTEASPGISILNAADSLRKDGSVGKILPFVDARIVDKEHNSLPPGEVGELICRGPNVMQGYHRNPQATKVSIQNGWLFTGDLARMDSEGFLYIVDRKKEMIVSGGENIYPREIEEVIVKHPSVADVAVIGIPHPTWGETVKAFVVPRHGRAIDEKEVIDFCKKYLASYKKPAVVAFLPEIPRNPSGKALKRILMEEGQ
ncbi:Long-chain-fatty-acid--CoA ligase (EC [Olavius sp. associated proteobacterium Delta 1]|nr:Long-chain-fatty-acid--CoA ligase (EC [Olavius sp. associated proteobacterium Delta 1]